MSWSFEVAGKLEDVEKYVAGYECAYGGPSFAAAKAYIVSYISYLKTVDRFGQEGIVVDASGHQDQSGYANMSIKVRRIPVA